MRNTKNFKKLPYNEALSEQAKRLRRAGILHEVLLWQQIKTKQFLGLDFDRQKIIGNYIVDFYCAEKNVVIEVDGQSHYYKYEEDKKRDNFLISLGLTVIRLAAKDVLQNLEGVMEFLSQHAAFTGTISTKNNTNHD